MIGSLNHRILPHLVNLFTSPSSAGVAQRSQRAPSPLSPQAPSLMDARSIVSVSPNAVFSEVSGEAVILNMYDGVYYGLDPVGVSIWKAMQQPVAIGRIHEVLLDEYDVEPDRCMSDLLTLLEQLERCKLVDVQPHAA